MGKYVVTRQHEPLRTPAGWTDQSRALVAQMNQVLDDVYRQISIITKRLDQIDERVKALEEQE